ncbi:hypothetical protein Bresa_01285|uniref:Uncharacterized protein n=1 Tax=Brenneria salicis ATCC 15712 = DSM 30166 TaxID=714314 RepID=A0A366I4S9_9GAMM|nr:hypothetical protein [Brenneria salicis ATCC 15712 = DSM 30166]RBP62335.1 hypothetical protein DES54_11777 [Brenneria salicis ATCC 15712 = DSM 30166]
MIRIRCLYWGVSGANVYKLKSAELRPCGDNGLFTELGINALIVSSYGGGVNYHQCRKIVLIGLFDALRVTFLKWNFFKWK